MKAYVRALQGQGFHEDTIQKNHHTYLMVRLERPVLPDDGVAEVADLPQHGLHEGGAQLGGIVLAFLPVTASDVLSGATVEVEGGALVQEGAATLHVPIIWCRWRLLLYIHMYIQVEVTCNWLHSYIAAAHKALTGRVKRF